MTEGVDFSWARPTPAQLLAAGKRFVIRYVPYRIVRADGSVITDGGKGLTAAEVAAYHGAGIDIVLVWEWYAGRFLEGYAAGAADARYAIAGLTPLGFPVGARPVFFACDKDTNSTQWPTIDAYFDGVASVMGRAWTGAYAEKELIDHLARADKARWHWQTYAWSGGGVSAEDELYQYLNGQSLSGSTVDLDRALKPDFGQWRASEMYPVVTVTPLAGGPRIWHVAAGVTLSGYDPAQPNQTLKTQKFASASTAHADAEVRVDWQALGGAAAPVPTGGPFLRVTDGVYAGLLIVKALVTLDPDPPAPTTGVPQAAYDTLNAQYEAAMQNLRDTEAKLTAAVTTRDTALAELADAEAEVTEANNARVAAESALADWQAFKDAAAKVGL